MDRFRKTVGKVDVAVSHFAVPFVQLGSNLLAGRLEILNSAARRRKREPARFSSVNPDSFSRSHPISQNNLLTFLS